MKFDSTAIKVEIIGNKEEVSKLCPFYVDKLLWGTKSAPTTYGYLGFIPDEGLCLKMVCEEKNPLRTYTKDNDPVYQDSAVEAFFLFESSKTGTGRPTYVNFEINANGALLASYGKERTYRSYFSEEERDLFQCEAKLEEEKWSVTLSIPISILERIYGPLNLGDGSYFTCNFYKISEAKNIEHYASYAPIESPIPSFHLPEYFADAQIV